MSYNEDTQPYKFNPIKDFARNWISDWFGLFDIVVEN